MAEIFEWINAPVFEIRTFDGDIIRVKDVTFRVDEKFLYVRDPRKNETFAFVLENLLCYKYKEEV